MILKKYIVNIRDSFVRKQNIYFGGKDYAKFIIIDLLNI